MLPVLARKGLRAIVLAAALPWTAAGDHFKANGIISYHANRHDVPMISDLSVLGTEIMPYDNVGAGFQMTGRSWSPFYNPTQAGDCLQTRSRVLRIDSEWRDNPLGLPAEYGITFVLQPRNYEHGDECEDVALLLPFEFEFAAALGDRTRLPAEGMLLEMALRRLQGAEVIEKCISELPTLYPHTRVLPMAYWSNDGASWEPFTVEVAGGVTHDVAAWPFDINYYRLGRGVMLCTRETTMCLALYSPKPTHLGLSRRLGRHNELTWMATTMDWQGSIDDFERHMGRRLLAVGTPDTVSAVIAQLLDGLDDWGDL